MPYGTVVVSLENRQYSWSPRAVKIPSGLPHAQSSLRPSSSAAIPVLPGEEHKSPEPRLNAVESGLWVLEPGAPGSGSVVDPTAGLYCGESFPPDGVLHLWVFLPPANG